MGEKTEIAPEIGAPQTADAYAVKVDEALIDQYITSLYAKGRSRATIQIYRGKLQRLYHFLPENKSIGKGTLYEFRDELLKEGYSPATINMYATAANGLLEYCGHRELQVNVPLKLDIEEPPELTREEYLRLLAAAKRLEKERAFFLLKVYVVMGLKGTQIHLVTVEALKEGQIHLKNNTVVHIPASLRKGLLMYARHSGIQEGSLFVTKNGRKMDQSNLIKEIRSLAGEAKVDPEKCSQASLRRLYQTTREQIWASMEVMVEQTLDQMIEKEDKVVGWG